MTLPHESARAVLLTRKFLFELLDPQKTPRVPRTIRRRAGELLRHYPWTMDALKHTPPEPHGGYRYGR